VSRKVLSAELVAAYRATEYRVAAQDPFTLHVDQHSAALAKLFRDTGNTQAGFLTADNPFSVPASERANRFKQALLRFLLPESSLPTVAHDPTGRWPDEHGFLVMGWSLRAVKALGITFGQNAVLWMGEDAVPKLVLLGRIGGGARLKCGSALRFAAQAEEWLPPALPPSL
jgi:hypothetical protein